MTQNELQSYGFMASEYDKQWDERLTVEEQFIFYARCRELGLDRLPRYEAIEHELVIKQELLSMKF